MNTDQSTESNPDVHLWERQPGETAKQYALFAAFRDMGPRRTLRGAWSIVHGRECRPGGNRYFALLSSQWRWVERAGAYDEFTERRKREIRESEHAEDIRQTLERQRKIGALSSGIAIKTLQICADRLLKIQPHEIEIPELVALMRTAVQVAKAGQEAEFGGNAIAELLGAIDEQI